MTKRMRLALAALALTGLLGGCVAYPAAYPDYPAYGYGYGYAPAYGYGYAPGYVAVGGGWGGGWRGGGWGGEGGRR